MNFISEEEEHPLEVEIEVLRTMYDIMQMNLTRLAHNHILESYSFMKRHGQLEDETFIQEVYKEIMEEIYLGYITLASNLNYFVCISIY